MDVGVLVFVAQVPVPLGPGGEPQLAHRAVHGGHRRHLLHDGGAGRVIPAGGVGSGD
jgi:hypothetical protein